MVGRSAAVHVIAHHYLQIGLHLKELRPRLQVVGAFRLALQPPNPPIPLAHIGRILGEMPHGTRRRFGRGAKGTFDSGVLSLLIVSSGRESPLFVVRLARQLDPFVPRPSRLTRHQRLATTHLSINVFAMKAPPFSSFNYYHSYWDYV